MKTLGEIRRAVKDLVKRVTELERKLDTVIEVFCNDSFENAKPPVDKEH